MSESYFKYWGKAEKDGPGYHLLPYHCLDVAAVGHVLLSRNALLRRRFIETTGLDESICCQWMLLFLGLHDIGKFSESFQNLRPDLLEKLQRRQSSRPYSVRHDSLGNLLWTHHLWRIFHNDIFSDISSFDEFAEDWQDIFGFMSKAHTGHHGIPPLITGSNTLPLVLSSYFSNYETKAAEDYFRDLHKLLLREYETSVKPTSPMELYDNMAKASWLMAGFAVLCDWIGSNSKWFPFYECPMSLIEYWQNYAIPQAERAIREAGIDDSRLATHKRTFKDLFPAISSPTPLQHHVAECPLSSSPQLVILEDVTGSGKTEAALFLAHRFMTEGLGNGVFIALPTMATSNAMYDRIAVVYKKLFIETSSPSLVLAHGARHLSESFMRTIVDSPYEQKKYSADDDTTIAQCVSWLADNRKKALLADVGVGTLDQALLAILPYRFQSLRLLGLAGHILIVDEVHAYDPYMNKLLQTLLSFHAALGGTAILLSATLPTKVRKDFIDSFARGLGMHTTPQLSCTAYPLATHLTCDNGIVEYPVAATLQRHSSVSVKIVSEQDEVMRLIATAARQGKCVCWIRNTVHDALAGYESLKKDIPPECLMLFHARFAMGDRLDTESAVRGSFDSKSNEEKRKGKVLVATQVVEQSLDLDFDLLISDLAPMDLLIQRAGRLHRHLRDDRGNPLRPETGPDQREHPCFIIHGPLPGDDADADWYKAAFSKAAFVYPSHGCLWLTSRLLRDRGVLRMPDDARELIEAAFTEQADELIPALLRKRDIAAEGQIMLDRSLAHINMLKLEEGYTATLNQWREDMRTPTRLGDMETTVRLAKWDGTNLTPWYAYGDFPWDMSQVSLRSALVYSEAEHVDLMLKAEIDKLKAHLPDKGKWSVLVPLICDSDGIWQGHALDRKGNIVQLAYDRATGVVVTKKEE